MQNAEVMQAFEERLAEAGFTCRQYRVQDFAKGSSALPCPIAVFAYTDIAARLVLSMASVHKIAIPEEMAVLGVGNDLLEREMSPVELSSVKVDGQDIGYEGARLLDAMLRSGGTEAVLRKIPPTGIETRASTDTFATEDPLVRKTFPGAIGSDQIKTLIISYLSSENSAYSPLLCRFHGKNPPYEPVRASIS